MNTSKQVIKIRLDPQNLQKVGVAVGMAAKLIKTNNSDMVGAAIGGLKMAYHRLSGKVYSTVRHKKKDVNIHEIKDNAKSLMLKLSAMESSPAPSANDISNDTVKKAIDNVINSNSFGHEVAMYNADQAFSYNSDESDIISKAITDYAKKIFIKAIKGGAEWGDLRYGRSDYEQEFNEIIDNLAKEGINVSSNLVYLRTRLKHSVSQLADITKGNVELELRNIHNYGERELFIKKTCDDFLKNKASDSSKMIKHSSFVKKDVRGSLVEAKTLGSMPVKKIKENLIGVSDLYGGYVPAMRFERIKSRAHASMYGGDFIVNVGSDTIKSTIWHEVSHHLEKDNDWILDLTTDYLAKKFIESTSRKKIDSLRNIMMNTGYDSSEIAIRNDIVKDGYILKLYINNFNYNDNDEGMVKKIKTARATEVLSMGGTYMAEGTLYEHSQDVDFISTVLTIIGKLQKDGKEWDTQ